MYLHLLPRALYSEWMVFHAGSYLFLFRGPSENNLSARPGSGLCLAWPGSQDQGSRVHGERPEQSPLYSLVFILSPLNFMKVIQLMRIRTGVKVVIITWHDSAIESCLSGLLYHHWLQNRNSTAEDFITITSTKCWCWSRAVVWFMLVLGPASGSGNGWYDSNQVYFIFWCLTRLL